MPVESGESAPEQPPETSEAPADNGAQPAGRPFDFIIARGDGVSYNPLKGSMEDNSISLGEYCRRLRLQKKPHTAPTPLPPPAPMSHPTPPPSDDMQQQPSPGSAPIFRI